MVERRGSVLIEIVITLGMSALLLTFTAAWLGQAYRSFGPSRTRGDGILDWQRLTRRIQADVAASDRRDMNEKTLTMISDDATITYEVVQHAIERRGPGATQRYLVSDTLRTQWVATGTQATLRMGRHEVRTDETLWTHRLIVPLTTRGTRHETIRFNAMPSFDG